MPTVTVIQPKVTDDTQSLLRVAAYCRVSSSSDDQLNSYNSQLTYYSHKFEESETECLIDIYADEGISGTSEEKRNEFLRLIDDCRHGKIDRVYTKSISRFARNTRDCLKNIRELKSLGITIMFEKENIDTANINDELMITIMGGLAQEESISISENMKWSIRRKMKSGTCAQVHAPFGYRLDNKGLVINEREAAIVQDIFNSYVNGNGIQSTVDFINKKYAGIVKLSYSTISYILRNERYIGDSLFQKTFCPDIFAQKRCLNKGEKDMYYIENTHEPIISRETFEIAHKILEKRFINNTERKEHIFSKKIVCGKCNSNFHRKKCRDKYYWVCNKHDYSASLCEARKITEDSVKEAFIRLFNILYSNYSELIISMHRSLQELMTKNTKDSANIIEIRRSILKLKEQLKVIATLRTKGFLNEAKYMEQSTEVNVKIKKLYKDIRLLSQSDDIMLNDIEMLIGYFEKREYIMFEFEPQAFEFLIDKIIVNNNTLGFHIIGSLIFIEEI
ncbi:recombinase family protein [Ruminococcus sp.]|uniref:recombinase family protein n=1 Tax=Ruminococcus sp. TaxID=41978 RepID=UPI0025FAC9B0|nr:recombinase family protein [Ruminococcus sp.]